MKKVWIGFILLFVVAGCAETKKVTYQDVSAREAKEMIAKGDVYILDVRSSSEFANGHIDGAVNVDAETLSFVEDVFPNKEHAILVYCYSGARSARASEMMIQMGYTDVYNLVGGFSAYGEGA